MDVNVATNRVYAANYLGNSVTAIDADGHQPVPLTTVITGVADSQTISPLPGSPAFQVFQTVNPTPSFTVNVTSAYSGTSPYTGLTATNPPPTQVYYEVDGSSPSKLGTVTSASGANPATYTITLPTQQTGLHVLFVFAAYGNEAGQTSGGVGNGDSPELGNLTAYPYVVDFAFDDDDRHLERESADHRQQRNLHCHSRPDTSRGNGADGNGLVLRRSDPAGNRDAEPRLRQLYRHLHDFFACAWYSHHQSDLSRRCSLCWIKRNLDPDDRSPAEPYCR